jgi:hypothetical protein
MCSTNYNSILNMYEAEDEDIQPAPAPQRPHVLLNIPARALFNQLRAALVQMNQSNSNLFEAFQLDQDQQYGMIALLQEAASDVEAEQLAQNSAIEVLQDGFLPRVHFEQDQLGGAHLLLTAGEQSTDPAFPSITPSSASLETYDAAGDIGSSVVLHGNLVTLAHNVRVEGELILNEKSVADQLQTLEDKATQYAIELASNFAIDAAQQALLAALSAYAARPPAGFEALPEDTSGDDDNDKSVSLNPFKLYPTGVYSQLDSLGNQIGLPETVAKGKASLNLQGAMCTRTFHMKGDILQEQQDPDDEVEFQSTVRLGSKVAAYDTQQQLSNPQAVAVRLGSGALVTTAGAVQAESLSADTVTCSTVNRVNVLRTLHAAQAPASKDYNRDIAIQSIRTSAALRLATKPILGRDFTVPLANIRDALTQVLRRVKPTVLSRDFTEDIQRLRVEAAVDRRELYRPLPLSKDFTPEIVELKQAVLASSTHKPVATLAADLMSRLKRLGDGLATVRRSIKPALSASYAAVIAVLKQAVAANKSDISLLRKKHDTLAPDLKPAIAQARAQTVAVQRRIKPVLSKSYDKQIAAVRQSVTAAISQNSIATQRLIKPSLSKSYDKQLAAVRQSVTASSSQSSVAAQRLIKPALSSSYTAPLARARAETVAAKRLIKPVLVQDSGTRKAVELYKRQQTAASSSITTGALTANRVSLTNTASSIAGLSSDTTIPVGQSWIRVGYFYYRFSGEIRIRISGSDTDRVFDQVTLSLDYNRSEGNGALDFQATLKHSNAYFNDRGISRVAVTNMDYGSFRSHGIYFLGPSAYSYDVSVSVVPFGSNPYNDQFLIDKPPVYEAPTVASYVTYFECKQRTDFAGSVNFQNGVISQKALTCQNGVAVSSGQLNFGSRSGSLINLFGSGLYTIGIQAGTQYLRTDQYFAFFKGGTHSDATLDSGGGNTIAYLDGNTYEMYLRGGTGSYTKVVRSAKNIVMSGNVGAANQSSGGINFGITFTSPPIVTLTINDAGGTVAAIYVAGVNTTGCNWSASNSGTGNRSINWIAHGSSTQ